MQWLSLLTLISVDGVQFPAKAAVSLIVSLSKSLSLCFMCSDQHVNYLMLHGFPLTSILLMNKHDDTSAMSLTTRIKGNITLITGRSSVVSVTERDWCSV